VASGRYSTPLMILGLILLLPFYLVGRTIYAPLERFIENFVKTKVKDPLFKNSIRLAFWTFLLPIYSILISGIASCFFDEKWLMFLMLIVALPLTGWLAKKWLFVYRKWRAVQSFLRFKNSNLRKFDEFEHLRNELIFIIKQKIS
jgi:ABC-type phosphate transport system permease subunit